MRHYFVERNILCVMATLAIVGNLAITSPSRASTIIGATTFGFVQDDTNDGNPDSVNQNNYVNVQFGGAGLIQARGVIEFNISSLATPVALATLNLEVTGDQRQPPNDPIVIDIYGSTGNGVIQLADYTPSGSPVPFNFNAQTTVDVDVTNLVNAQIGQQYIALLLVWATSTSTGTVNFNGRPVAAPTLTVDVSAVPLPAALPLFASGTCLLGFIGWRRKRRG
jgi:hypothetical protein